MNGQTTECQESRPKPSMDSENKNNQNEYTLCLSVLWLVHSHVFRVNRSWGELTTL